MKVDHEIPLRKTIDQWVIADVHCVDFGIIHGAREAGRNSCPMQGSVEIRGRIVPC